MRRLAASKGGIFIMACALALCLPPARALAAPLVPSTADTVHIAPHRALYEIRMVSKRSSSQVLNVSGTMYFEWRVGCDSWTTDHRFRLFYEYADSDPLIVTSNFVTYEPFDGTSLAFSSRRSRNGEIYEELSGNALRNADNSGHAAYTAPPDLSFDLPPGTLFPMFHTVEMIRQAETGRRFFNATVFDGSDDEGPVEINTFIGKRMRGLDAVAPGPHVDKKLLGSSAWTVRMAFFPILKPDADSEYEMDAVLQANGIISDMRVDYHDFTITQKLVALDALPAESCPGKKPLP